MINTAKVHFNNRFKPDKSGRVFRDLKNEESMKYKPPVQYTIEQELRQLIGGFLCLFLRLFYYSGDVTSAYSIKTLLCYYGLLKLLL